LFKPFDIRVYTLEVAHTVIIKRHYLNMIDIAFEMM
jgi:hypothetical protein